MLLVTRGHPVLRQGLAWMIRSLVQDQRLLQSRGLGRWATLPSRSKRLMNSLPCMVMFSSSIPFLYSRLTDRPSIAMSHTITHFFPSSTQLNPLMIRIRPPNYCFGPSCLLHPAVYDHIRRCSQDWPAPSLTSPGDLSELHHILSQQSKPWHSSALGRFPRAAARQTQPLYSLVPCCS
jgi:hypothetical protein